MCGPLVRMIAMKLIDIVDLFIEMLKVGFMFADF